MAEYIAAPERFAEMADSSCNAGVVNMAHNVSSLQRTRIVQESGGRPER